MERWRQLCEKLSQPTPEPASPIFQPLSIFAQPPPELLPPTPPELETYVPPLPSVEVPQHFIDPITMEIMKDPCRLPSGHTLDRTTSITSQT